MSADPTPTSRVSPASPPEAGPMIGSARIDAMSVVLARNWWLMALRGLAAILFGVVALIAPGVTVLTLVLFFSAYMLVDGFAGIFAAVRAAQKHERWGLLLIEGLLNLAVGVAAFLMPGAAVWAFVFLLAVWAVVTGVLMVVSAFSLHQHYGRWWLILGGVISVLFGLALLVNPSMSAIVLTWWLGAYAIAFGILLLILGFQLRGRHEAAGRPLPTDTAA